MSLTRSHSPGAPATECIIVSHGSPSDPEPQEVFVSDLARTVAEITGANVRGATLAKKGSLEQAVQGMSNPVIFPHFMADGWFVSVNLPKRLNEAGLDCWHVSTPLGMIEDLWELALEQLQAAIVENNLRQSETTLVVAAHGSPSDPSPARVTETFSSKLRQSGLFKAVRVGYVDEEPSLADAASVTGSAVVLPFFASSAGHVLIDLPEALESVSFGGLVLPPIGTWPEIPKLISNNLTVCSKAKVA